MFNLIKLFIYKTKPNEKLEEFNSFKKYLIINLFKLIIRIFSLNFISIIYSYLILLIMNELNLLGNESNLTNFFSFFFIVIPFGGVWILNYIIFHNAYYIIMKKEASDIIFPIILIISFIITFLPFYLYFKLDYI